MTGVASTTGTVARSTLAVVNGILSGTAWTGAITYAFPADAGDYTYTTESSSGFAAITDAMEASAVFALDSDNDNDYDNAFSVAGFTNLAITAGDAASSTLRIAQSTIPATAYAYMPTTADQGGDIWFGKAYNYTAPQAGNYAWHTMLHEIGHALGLKHPHEKSGTFGIMGLATDSVEYTVMSYRAYTSAKTTGYTYAGSSAPQTYMIGDIAALQHMYGADFTANSGDTVYTWSASSGDTYIDGELAIDAVGNTIFAAIWDGGGIDTYDVSTYTTAMSINLTPGAASSFNTAQLASLGGGKSAKGNIYNAYLYQNNTASLIENVATGSGADLITGNIANNLISSGAGSDKIYALAGDDTISAGSGDNYVDANVGNDYVYTGDGNDTIITALGNDVVEDSGGTNSITDTGGNNEFLTGSGNDTIKSGAGNDVIYAGAGNNAITDTGGINQIYATGGNDVINTGGGADTIEAGDGNNTVTDKGGANFIETGSGNDIIKTGAGADSIIAGSGDNTITDTGGINTIYAGAGNDKITTGIGADTIYAYDGTNIIVDKGGANTIYGGSGIDTVTGGTGVDTVYAYDGANIVKTGLGNDIIYAGDGIDTLYGEGGNDIIYGYAGADTINGGIANDQLYGGDGADTFVFEAANLGRDTIFDFDIDTDILKLGTAAMKAVVASATQVGNDVVITFSSLGVLTLTGVALADMADILVI